MPVLLVILEPQKMHKEFASIQTWTNVPAISSLGLQKVAVNVIVASTQINRVSVSMLLLKIAQQLMEEKIRVPLVPTTFSTRGMLVLKIIEITVLKINMTHKQTAADTVRSLGTPMTMVLAFNQKRSRVNQTMVRVHLVVLVLKVFT